jgi:conjugal transfer pilus assembly protein TraB
LIGEIDSSPVAIGEDDKKKSQADGKNTIYLPPSFVEATLLSGVTAKTSAQAKEDPSPLLFRIKNLAILPNNVKANIKGCFVIAEGVGDLADERVHTRLTTLSCVAKNGESVIDQEIKGWVEDNADGKVGLKGAVVAKMGMHIARSALAGFVGGFGDALSASTMTTAMTTSGVPSTAYVGDGMKDYAKAGAGQGIKGASDDLKKFYLELAQQTIPVIEVLPAKAVTLVFSAGVNLEIKNVKMGGLKK